MHLKILTSKEIVLSLEVRRVTLKSANGYISILPKHAPFISYILPSYIEVEYKGGKKRLKVNSGIVEVKNNKVVILICDFLEGIEKNIIESNEGYKDKTEIAERALNKVFSELKNKF